jgi:CBS domain-containing protein
MKHEVMTLDPDEKLDLVEDIMRLGRVRHMPVVSGTKLVGILSARDLLAASLTKALEFGTDQRRAFLRSVSVGEVMTPDPLTASPETTLREAAELMLSQKVGCLPVVSADGTLRGLVTETDLLSAAYLSD